MLVMVITAPKRAAAVQTRSRAGSASALLSQRSSVASETPTSSATALSLVFSGGNSWATTLFLNCCPYRATSLFHCRPSGGFYPGDNYSDVGGNIPLGTCSFRSGGKRASYDNKGTDAGREQKFHNYVRSLTESRDSQQPVQAGHPPPSARRYRRS